MISYQNFNKIFDENEIYVLKHHTDKSGLHWHSAVEVLYVESGSLSVNLEGEKKVVSSGEIVVVNAEVLHGFEKLSDDLSYYFLMVSDEFLKSKKLYGEMVFITPIIKSNELEKVYLKMIKECEQKSDCYKVLISSLIIQFFVILNRSYKMTLERQIVSEDKKINLIRRATSYISEHYREKLSVDDIANYLHFSKSYLSHSFKEITGYSIVDYINLIRCHNAKLLLFEGYTVSEVSNELGFSDISYFSRIFKKVTGQIPSSVKKN